MELLKGLDVANSINAELIAKLEQDKTKVPQLAIIRVGDRPDDVSYEHGATKKMEKIG